MSDKNLLDYQAFIDAYPEFGDVDAWPTRRVELRIGMANTFVRTFGLEDAVVLHLRGLYTAHYLAAQGSSNADGTLTHGALGGGIVASKGVDGASVSYDTGTNAEEGAGFWNSTVYGREYWQLMQMLGAGGVQL